MISDSKSDEQPTSTDSLQLAITTAVHFLTETQGERNKIKYSQKFNKVKRNSGEEYITANSKIIFPKRLIVEPCCVKKCGDKVTLASRQTIFDNFWKLADFKKQNLFLNASVKRETPKQRRPRNSDSKLRESSFRYYLTHENENVLVCKKFFIDTFNISKGRLHRVLKRDDPAEDLRGKSENSRRTTEESLINEVKEHIKSFPVFSSTNCVKHSLISKKSTKKYLSPDLNIRKMYNLYLEKSQSDQRSHVKECIYRKIFKTHFNLQFHQPKDEICQKCEFLKIKVNSEDADICDKNQTNNFQNDLNIKLENSDESLECIDEY